MWRGLLQTSYATQVSSRLKSLVEPQSARRAQTEAELRSESDFREKHIFVYWSGRVCCNVSAYEFPSSPFPTVNSHPLPTLQIATKLATLDAIVIT